MKSIFFSILFVFISTPLYAYIDPGIMTIIWQSILLVFASIGAGIGIFYSKIKEFFLYFKKNKKIDKKDNK